MKKTISTSIGGIVFNVEEDAHDKLAAYIDAISASMRGSEGHDEIMSDIESRIAEILKQKMDSYKEVVTLAEVDEVIAVMGNPEDFGSAGGESKQTDSSVGNQYGYSGRRRVYKDVDDKVLLGVCSGLSHHFGVDPIWLRLAFGLSIFIGGFGVILYFLLAIITPKARTAAEKLEMMGEPVDVHNIRKIIEDDMDGLKKKVKDFGNDIRAGRGKDRAKDFGKDMGDFVSSAGNGFGNLFTNVLKAILAFIGVIIAVVLGAILIGLIVSLTSGVNVIHIESNGHQVLHYSVRNFLDMLSVSGNMRMVLITGVILFFGIPLLALIVRFGRAAAGRREPFQSFSIAAGILWCLAWVLMIIGIASVFSHFSVTDFTRKEAIVNPSSKNMLYVKLNDKGLGKDVVELDSLNVYITDQDEFQGNPSLAVENSPDSNYHLVLTKVAKGINKAEADEYADYIDYDYTFHDSTLVLDHFFTLDVTKGWRKQKLDLTIQVPDNKSIALPEGWDYVSHSPKHHKKELLGGQKWMMSNTGLIPGK